MTLGLSTFAISIACFLFFATCFIRLFFFFSFLLLCRVVMTPACFLEFTTTCFLWFTVAFFFRLIYQTASLFDRRCLRERKHLSLFVCVVLHFFSVFSLVRSAALLSCSEEFWDQMFIALSSCCIPSLHAAIHDNHAGRCYESIEMQSCF